MAPPLINKFLAAGVQKKIRQEIAGNSGNEIFFHGKAIGGSKITEIEALAWGNETGTPALLERIAPQDVVLHNHPSGNLTPSEVDVQIASIVGNQGIGFYIIDNDVTDLKIVVDRYEQPEQILLDSRDIAGLLDEGSQIAGSLPGFEPRPSQLAMTQAISESLNKGKVAQIEAGTGTGKTLAYLVPAIQWALLNKERIVISTNTINLQEQIVYKDIPFLETIFDNNFASILVKGRRNYCCLRKADAEEKELGFLKGEESIDELQTLLSWSKSTRDGSLSDLNFVPKPDVWDRLKCENDTCTGVRCSFYEECFLVNARRKASQADLLIVNHHLLFADLSLRGALGSLSDVAVLPPYTRIIIDEAHHVEEASTECFGRQVSQFGIKRLFGRLVSVSKRGERKGLLPMALRKLGKAQSKSLRQQIRRTFSFIEDELISDIHDLSGTCDDVFLDVAGFLEQTGRPENGESRFILDERFYSEPDWTDLILVKFKGLTSGMRTFKNKLLELLKSLDAFSEHKTGNLDNFLIELQAQARRIGDTAESIHYMLFEEDEAVVKWIERSGKQKAIKITAAPIEVGEPLRKSLFEPFETVVLTSATLTIGGSFEFLKSRLGIDQLDRDRVMERSLASPFDFMRQVLIGIPVNNHPPDHPLFPGTMHSLISESLQISQGRAFVLFTSYFAMNEAFKVVKSELGDRYFTLLKQGNDTRHNLLHQFKKDHTAVLFATDSFWEGVDVMGEALESIIIARLPFRVPVAPIEIARRDLIDRRGANSFLEYTVPTAVIKFKQGFGRLIRHKEDRGTVLILDNRTVTKPYGKIFLDSLPECRIVIDRDDVVFEKFREFYRS